nr:MAG TPA: hypothetical protein [Caudoviricetes sp.]
MKNISKTRRLKYLLKQIVCLCKSRRFKCLLFYYIKNFHKSIDKWYQI